MKYVTDTQKKFSVPALLLSRTGMAFTCLEAGLGFTCRMARGAGAVRNGVRCTMGTEATQIFRIGNR